MKMEVEVISSEIIKPTTSPPDKYKFSFLDRSMPPLYTPFIYFFSLDRYKLSQTEISTHLKTSLSLVLNHYYPLVGTVQENFIDCNNGGVLVLEARVNCKLSEFLRNPNPDKFVAKFFPDNVNDFVSAVQITFFNCSGIAIGVCISHKVADASSMITFINNWAGTARGDIDNIHPKIVGTGDLFPTKDGVDESSYMYPPTENVILKRFVFTNSSISALKEKYIATSSTESSRRRIYPSRFKTLSSFLWSRFAVSTEKKKLAKTSYWLIFTVNLRKMIDPPLPDDSFGNLAGVAQNIISSVDDIDKEGYNYRLMNEMTRVISKIDKDFVRKLQDGIFWEGLDENTFKGDQQLICFTCSSICSFPIYEADFGWGKPAWFAYGGIPVRNTIVLVDTKNGDGIEAWVHLTEEDMPKFESDKELLTYASPTLARNL